MPDFVRTFSNPRGSVQANAYDDLNERAQNRALQAQLQGEALRAQLHDSAANRAAQLQMQGSFADKSALEASMLDKNLANRLDLGRLTNEGNLATTRASQEPNLLHEVNMQNRYTTEREDTAPERALKKQRAELEARLMGNIFADQGASLGPFTSAPPTGMMAPSGAPSRPVGQGVAGPGGPMGQDDLLRWAYFNKPEALLEKQQNDARRKQQMDEALMQEEIAAAKAQGRLDLIPRIYAKYGGNAGMANDPLAEEVFKQAPGIARHRSEEATQSYLGSTPNAAVASPILLQRVQQLVPGLIEVAKRDPQSIALAVNRAINPFVVEAEKENADPNLVADALRKQLVQLLRPELERMRSIDWKKLGLGAATGVMPIVAPYTVPAMLKPSAPQAADVLREARY